MPRALLLFLTNLALAAIATAQPNLVPNPSFEDTTYCVGWPPPQVEALHWYNVNMATPDIWDCDTIDPCGYHVMDPNDPGVQLKGYLHSFDGTRHAGGFHWYGAGGSNTRDYLMVELTEQLQAGQHYEVSLHYARPSGHCTGIDRIGVYLGPDSVFYNTLDTIPLTPQVELMLPGGGYLSDTVWTKLTDTLTADGTEQWLIFGTFRSDDFVNGALVSAWTASDNTYYYVDHVSVQLILGNEVPNGPSTSSALRMVDDCLVWYGSGDLGPGCIVDAAGRVVERLPRLQRGSAHRLTRDLPPGVYVAWATGEVQNIVARFVK